MPIDELVEALKPFGIDAVDLDMLQRGDKLDKAGAKFYAAMERLLAERDEAVNWTETVERHGTDGFDALADTWLAMEAIKRVNNAVTSVFSKWSNDALMERFKQHITGTMHVSFVEGCLVGVKAERVNSAAAEAHRDNLEKALTKIIDMNVQYAVDKWGDAAKAEDMACVRVARQALQDSKP